MSTAKLILDGKEYEFPVVVGSEGEVGIDIAKLRDVTGAITLDEGYGNTGSCRSAITFIDGDRGILRYRDQLGGYHSLDQLAEVYVLKDKPEALAQLQQATLPPDAHQRLWDTLNVSYFMRHDAGEIAWHTRELAARVTDGMTPT